MSIRTIESVVKIEEDRKLVLQLPSDIPVGRHRVIAHLDDAQAEPNPNSTADAEWAFPVLSNAQWPADMPLSREEFYDDDGR